MPTRLADPLYDHLRSAFPPDRAYAQADWDNGAMPAPVACFLDHTLQASGRHEARRLREARTGWVDYTHPEVEESAQAFFGAVADHAQVPADEWENTLRHAVDRTTAHLVRPVPTLTDFVFDGREEALPLDHLRRRMQFFGPYAYLRKAVRAFAEKRDRDTLSPETFNDILRRVDERITADYDAAQWRQLLAPLFDVAERAYGHERVPVALLRTVFEEKNHPTLVERLQTHAQDEAEAVDPDTFERIIAEGLASSSPSQGVDDREPGASLSGRATASETTPPLEPEQPGGHGDASDDDIWGIAGETRPHQRTEGTGSADTEKDEQRTPLWKQFQDGRTARLSAPSDEAEEQPRWAQFRRGHDTRAARAAGKEGSGGSRPSASSAHDTSESLTAKQASDESEGAAISDAFPDESEDLVALERAVLGAPASHRRLYVRQLFGGDRSAYRAVLRRIRTAESWSEASDIIASDIFRKHKVNIYSDAAVHFTNAVESRFRD